MDETKRVIVDFDGTICGFAFPDTGPLEPGVKEALQEIRDMGYEIVIHSCSTSTHWRGVEDLKNSVSHFKRIFKFMVLHDLPFDRILADENYDKPIASFYIDDRGIGYHGNWNDVVNEIIERGD
ncbi:hypothetical protein LCGC14_1109210 [marine sediment metagenome]|uniref:FCP1 homology domain-containing protein n=1 Tax=marine sediment metagenome TaxID=412755 RepID=A0A0F9M7D3_9ZZZZ